MPLPAVALEVLKTYSTWYLEKFEDLKPNDSSSRQVSLSPPTRQSRAPASRQSGGRSRWMPASRAVGTMGGTRLFPGLAESGEASDQTIMDIAGHVSKRMLKHYSHIRMEAKRHFAHLVAQAGSSS